MKLTMLGTGNALVTECYNTCFVLSEGERHFLVDGGGGNTLLSHLKEANINWRDINSIFVTHKHVDHLLGIIWMVRMICQHMRQGEYEGEATIYGHEEVIVLLEEFAHKLFPEKETKFIGDRLHLISVSDGEERVINDHKVTFFDIGSTKAKQYGFSIELSDGEKLTCCGDEPYNECEKVYAQNSKWMMQEAFCLYAEADIFKPYEKHHSTVREASQQAEELGVKNLVLYHTEDTHLTYRKQLYSAEARKYFSGNLYVPDDLDSIEL